MSDDKVYDLLQRTKKELMYENRFHMNDEFKKYLDRFIKQKTYMTTIEEGEILFRARLYLEDDQYEKYRNPPKTTFQGYDKENSFVNSSGNVKEGRINPIFIPYLYVSTTIEGAMVEVRPYADTLISVAEIKVLKDLNIIDFSKNLGLSSGINGEFESALFLYINREFSKPCYKDGDYLLLQYISEYIKLKGFDGVMYTSAFSRNILPQIKSYKNIAIFNYSNCEAINSKLYMSDKVDLIYRDINQR
ncbi:MAG TPA: RES family NAD+ phosphorylase [Defluviitaleaceae bacterium]|nr:RES family NAD+ phosphorylase [Defluviitaleaceae bacterium]